MSSANWEILMLWFISSILTWNPFIFLLFRILSVMTNCITWCFSSTLCDCSDYMWYFVTALTICCILWLLWLYVVICDCSDYMMYFVTALTICGILWLLWLYVVFCYCSDYMWYFVTALTLCGIFCLLWIISSNAEKFGVWLLLTIRIIP